jgi:hypothetical protein
MTKHNIGPPTTTSNEHGNSRGDVFNRLGPSAPILTTNIGEDSAPGEQRLDPMQAKAGDSSYAWTTIKERWNGGKRPKSQARALDTGNSSTLHKGKEVALSAEVCNDRAGNGSSVSMITRTSARRNPNKLPGNGGEPPTPSSCHW